MHPDFPSRLCHLVAAYGGPTKAAPLLGVTRQTINLWLRSKGNPSLATQAGALHLLKLDAPAYCDGYKAGQLDFRVTGVRNESSDKAWNESRGINEEVA